MHKRLFAATAAVSLLVAPLANANDVTYNFVEAGLGPEVLAGYEVTDSLFISAGHQEMVLTSIADLEASHAGAFYHWFRDGEGAFFSRPTSAYIGATMERTEVSGTGWNVDDTPRRSGSASGKSTARTSRGDSRFAA